MTHLTSPARTRVLLALITVYQRDGRATVPGVALAAGRSRAEAHRLLVALREQGLCDWTDGAAGTLRPTVAIVRTARTCVRPTAQRPTTLGGQELSGDGAAGNSPSPGQHPAERGRHEGR